MSYEQTLKELVERIVLRQHRLNFTPTSPFDRCVQICALGQARARGEDIPHYSKGKLKAQRGESR